MHEHEEDDPELLSDLVRLGYDYRDVKVDGMWKHAIGLFGGVGICAALGYATMWYFDSQQVLGNEGREARTQDLPEQPYPLLQSNVTVKKDIKDLRAQEKLKTDTAGWVDKDAGVAHIPVSVAKRIFYIESRRAPQQSPAEATPPNAGQEQAPATGQSAGGTP